MLQIISGNYFTNPQLLKSKGICLIYSNLYHNLPIKTSLFILTPLHSKKYPYTYLLEYENCVEEEEIQVSKRIFDLEIINQILILSSIGLNSYFSLNENAIIELCQKNAIKVKKLAYSTDLLPNYLNEINYLNPNIFENFKRLIDKIVNLSRVEYKAVILSLKTVYDSIRIVNDNFDLAYSMLVYSIESLSQRTNYPETKWEWYDQTIKSKLDVEFNNICKGNAEKIINILLSSSHQKSQQRFIQFIINNTSGSYFISNSWGVKEAITKPDFELAIKNSYKFRSGYVHKLDEIMNQLKVHFIAGYDVYSWDNQPYYTYRGLLRLCTNVIFSFINQSMSVDIEQVNWKNELPDVMFHKLSPKHWIFITTSLNIDDSSARYAGLLTEIRSMLLYYPEFVDLRDLLKIYETKIGNKNIRIETRLSMFAMYYFYNIMIEEKGKMINYESIINQNIDLLKLCNIRNFPIFFYFGLKIPYSIKDMKKELKKYLRQKYTKSGFVLNHFFESIIFLNIGSICFQNYDLLGFLEMYNLALYNNSGNKLVQKRILESISSPNLISTSEYIHLCKVSV